MSDLDRRLMLTAAALAAMLMGAPACNRQSVGGEAEDDHTHDDGHGHEEEDAHDERDEHESEEHEHDEVEHVDEVVLTAEAIDRYGITVGTAAMHTLKYTFVVPARAGFSTEAMAHVGSPLSGRVVEIKVRVGDEVKTRQELLVVESPELGEAQAEYFERRVAERSAQPAVDLAKAAWDRARELHERSEAVSLTEVQRRETEHAAMVASQQAAQASVVSARQRLRLLGMSAEAIATLEASEEIEPRFTIRAPIDGQVLEREVTLGEMVHPERDALMVLADTRVLWVLAAVPEARLPELATGARAWVTLGPGGSGGARFEGRIGFVAAQVDPETRTAQARIEVPAGALPLKAGMFAQVEIEASTTDGGEPAPVVAVPDEAVQTIEGGPAVFVPVAGEENTFALRPVRIGPAMHGLIPILAGLAAGEKVVISGTFMLKADLGKAGAAHEH
jgi:membrane fusion protein, heavy metal efflux system